MASDKKGLEVEAQEKLKTREELKARIEQLEWSLAQKNRQNKFLRNRVDEYVAENKCLSDEIDKLTEDSGEDSQSG